MLCRRALSVASTVGNFDWDLEQLDLTGQQPDLHSSVSVELLICVEISGQNKFKSKHCSEKSNVIVRYLLTVTS